MQSAIISEATIETINIMSTPDCTVENQTIKFESFKDKIISEEYLNDFDFFNIKLKKFKKDAQAAMDQEKEIKKQNEPDIFKIFLLPSKSVSYFLYSSSAKQYYDDQFYLSSKKTAEESYSQYEKFWNTTETEHVAISVLLWSVVIALFLKFIAYPIVVEILRRQ